MISRRAFLKIGAVVGGAMTAALLADPTRWARLAPEDARLAREGWGLGALLAPADHVAWLIQTGALTHLAGTPNRPHDPEGRYSVPFRLRGLTVRHLSGSERPALADLQRRSVIWPDDARAAMAAALLALGRSPNAVEAASLSAGERWLRAARPRVAVEAWLAHPPRLAWQDLRQADFRAPREGLIVSEWDWVILAQAPAPHLAEDFIRRQTSTWQKPPADAIALAALPATASFEICRIFERVAVRPAA